MEGIKTQKMSGEFNQMEESQVEEQKLGLGFQKPNSPDRDFTDQTLDRKLSGDRDEELSRKLEKLDVEGSKNGEEVRSLVSDSGIDEERGLEEVIDEEKQKLETKEGLIGEERSSVEKIGGEIAGNGGVGDGDGSFTNGAAAETEDTKHSGAEYEAIRGKIDGNSDEIGDGGLKGFANGTAVETEDRRCSGEESEAIDGEEEGEENGADFEKVKDGNADKDGSKWSQIENEEGNEAEECRVVEENGADYKEVKGGSADKGVSKWSQIEDEERNDNIDAKEWVEDEEEDKVEAPNNYESNWGITENGGDGNWGINVNGGDGDGDGNGDQRFGSYDKPQTFDNYEDERNGEEHYDGEANWYKNAERSSVGFNDGNYGSFPYPLRPDAEDCSFYMKTGNCKFGSNCKFNHPLRRKNQANEPFKQKEEYSDRSGQTECKYHLTPGGCKYGKACRYNHSRGKPVAPVLEFNFLGLPIRAGERECPYYMRTGSCKYGSNCRFNHPDPTAVGGGDSASQGRLKDNVQGWPSARTLNGTAPFVPVIYPPTPTAPPNAEWNGYKAPAYPTSERNLPTPPAFAMSIPIDANFYGQPRPQLIVEEFPERPGQPECSYYLKTGDCKYRSTCKFHHPKSRSPRISPFTLGNQGLPLRPDQNICTHYSRYGKCKYGPSCKFSHPVVSNGNLASSVWSDQGEPPHYGNSRNAEEEWNM